VENEWCRGWKQKVELVGHGPTYRAQPHDVRRTSMHPCVLYGTKGASLPRCAFWHCQDIWLGINCMLFLMRYHWDFKILLILCESWFKTNTSYASSSCSTWRGCRHANQTCRSHLGWESFDSHPWSNEITMMHGAGRTRNHPTCYIIEVFPGISISTHPSLPLPY
jgi:hypothetical protein